MMIAKLQTISYTANALAYCERGGELLFSNECLGNSNQIFKQMQYQQRLNDRCKKKSFHIKIRAAPSDNGKLSNQDWIDIAKKYAKSIGFSKNQYAVYFHEKATDRQHIHIVCNRIRNNKAVHNKFTHYKSLKFCKKIEKEYKLQKVPRKLEKFKNNEQFIPNNSRSNSLKKLIFEAINNSVTIDDVVFQLKENGIKTTIGRGISFKDAKGVSFKGSAIDRELSLSGIKKQLLYKEQEKRFNRGISQ